MTTLEHKDSRRQFADLFDWAESLPSLFTWPAAMRGVRIEEFADDNAYVVRAELPGLDPAKDIKVEVANGMMTITATRQQEEHDGARSEFHYGSLPRRVLLPDGADEAKVEAKYAAGIPRGEGADHGDDGRGADHQDRAHTLALSTQVPGQ